VSEPLERSLDRLARVRGVRGAMFVVADDGIVVTQLLMEDVNGKAVAALAASLSRKIGGAARVAGAGAVRFAQLDAAEGTLLVSPAPNDLLVVVLADPQVNVGLCRLEMTRAAEAALG